MVRQRYSDGCVCVCVCVCARACVWVSVRPSLNIMPTIMQARKHLCENNTHGLFLACLYQRYECHFDSALSKECISIVLLGIDMSSRVARSVRTSPELSVVKRSK
jgi:hypothetical protein